MQIVWTRPAGIPVLQKDEVHLWRLSVAEVSASEPSALGELTPGERVRAAGFRVEHARSEFVFGRCLLRRLAGAACGVKSGELVLTGGPFGKPLAEDARGVDFNVSHSRGVILIGVSRAGPVGVDVEKIDDRRTSVELVEIAKAILGPDEVTALRQMEPGTDALKAFYRAWTRREAVAKASGRGIAAAALYTVIREAGDATYRATLKSEDESDACQYLVHSFEVKSGYAGAVATCNKAYVMHYDAAALFV